MRQFYLEHITNEEKSITFPEDESKHICRVLRMKTGDKLSIVNGKGWEFEAEIFDDHPKRCSVNILSSNFEEKLPYHIHIAVAPTKNMERIEWFLEKATEIGVDEVSFIEGENSERSKLKYERLEKILIAAMKQSKRKWKPQLNELIKVSQFLEENPNGLFAHCYSGEKTTITKSILAENTPILIGPEGDFSENEVQKALKFNYKSISLGQNRLRTETAALFACAEAKLSLK